MKNKNKDKKNIKKDAAVLCGIFTNKLKTLEALSNVLVLTVRMIQYHYVTTREHL